MNETQLRRRAHINVPSQFVPEKGCRLFEGALDFRRFQAASEGGVIDLRVGKILGYANFLNGQHTESRIIEFVSDNRREFTLNLGTDPVGSAELTRHVSVPGSDLASDFRALEDLDVIPDFHVIVILDADTAFRACLDLTDVILVTAQRFQGTFVYHHIVPQHADR